LPDASNKIRKIRICAARVNKTLILLGVATVHGVVFVFSICGRDSTRRKQRPFDVLDPGCFNLLHFLLTALVGRPWLTKA
jgi:hypothetical protein